MKTFKIGRKEYQIKPGDYIQDNGSCLLFCSGDCRTIRWESYSEFNYVTLTAKAAKELNYKSLPVSYHKSSTGYNLTRYTY